MTAVGEIGQDALCLSEGILPQSLIHGLEIRSKGKRVQRGIHRIIQYAFQMLNGFRAQILQDGAHIRMSGSTGHHRDLIGLDRQQDMPHQAQGDDTKDDPEKDEKPYQPNDTMSGGSGRHDAASFR